MSLYLLKHILFFLIITLVFNQEPNKTYSFDDYNETKGKLALIGCGGLRSLDDFNSAMNSGFCEFVAAGCANLLNKDLGILLEAGKGDEINLALDPEHPEKYLIPKELWKACLTSPGWLPPIKGEPQKNIKHEVRFKAAI